MVSQPFLVAASSSQLPQPSSQLATAQLPVAQLGVAWALSQLWPQAPQLLGVVSEVSQPLLGLPSQSCQPMAHTGTQPLAAQAVVPWALLQASPQLRQWLVVPSALSQPGALVQSSKPGAQASSMQARPTHLPAPFGK